MKGRDVHAAPMDDAVVVGGGPGGAAAAATLARGGARVTVLEEFAVPRYKTCGGGVVGRARRWLPAGIAFERECHRAILYEHGCDLNWTVERSTPSLATTMRAGFDAALLDAAAAAGAGVHAPCRALDIDVGAEHVTVHTTRGEFRARYVIAADGARSRIASRSGWKGEPRCVPALEYEIQVDDTVRERFAAARFDFGLVPGGYGWVFPKRAHLSVGVLSTRPEVRRLPTYLATYLAAAGVSGIRHAEKHGALIPAAPRPGGFVRGRVLLVGDAAGLADPLTYEGISSALASGTLAARSLLEAEFEPAATRKSYEAALEHDVLPELRAARRLASILYGSARVREFAFGRAGQALCEAMCDVVAGERTAHDLVQSPASWARLVRVLAGSRRAVHED